MEQVFSEEMFNKYIDEYNKKVKSGEIKEEKMDKEKAKQVFSEEKVKEYRAEYEKA